MASRGASFSLQFLGLFFVGSTYPWNKLHVLFVLPEREDASLSFDRPALCRLTDPPALPVASWRDGIALADVDDGAFQGGRLGGENGVGEQRNAADGDSEWILVV